MRKIFFLIAILGLLALPAAGQGGFTTVSGTVIDGFGIPWSGGTITAQLITTGGTAPTLNGVSFSGTSVSGILSPTGSFTIRLGDSGVIVPGTTSWQFTVSISPGVLPPTGKGPQSFTVTTPINCGTNTPTACAGNAMNITAALAPVPPLVLTFFQPFVGLSVGAPGASLYYFPTVPGSGFHIQSNGSNTDTFTIINGSSTRVEFRVDATNNITYIGNSVEPAQIVVGGQGGGAASPGFMSLGDSTATGQVTLGGPSSRINTQAANTDYAGTLTCAASTATKTFSVTYTSTPVILVFDETTKGGVNLTAKSATGFTVSCTGATDVLDYIIAGNPN